MSNRELIIGGVASVLTAAAIFVGGLFGVVDSDNPDPLPGAPQASDYNCPSGWDKQVVAVEDAVAPRCERGDYIVWVHPDSSFSHGARVNDNDEIVGDFITDPTQVPDWQ